MISSVSGVGKSIIALHLSVCVLAGKPWLGIATKQGSVAYWDQDNPDNVLTRNRICAIAKGLNVNLSECQPAWIFRAHGPILNSPAEVRLLLSELLLRNVKLLVVDTLAAVNPFDESSTGPARLITQGLNPLAEAGITPIVLHHIGKAFVDYKGHKHQRTGTDAPRGHSSLVAACGAAYNLLRDGDERYLEQAKPRYGSQPTINIDYDEDGAMGLPDWSIHVSSPRVSLSQENLTHQILTNKWQNYTSRKLVKTLQLKGFSVSQSTANRALSESRRVTYIKAGDSDSLSKQRP